MLQAGLDTCVFNTGFSNTVVINLMYTGRDKWPDLFDLDGLNGLVWFEPSSSTGAFESSCPEGCQTGKVIQSKLPSLLL